MSGQFGEVIGNSLLWEFSLFFTHWEECQWFTYETKMASILVCLLHFSIWHHLQGLNKFPLTMKTFDKSVRFALKPDTGFMVWCKILIQTQVWSSWKLKGYFILTTLKHLDCGWNFVFRLQPDEKHAEVQICMQIERYLKFFRLIFWLTYTWPFLSLANFCCVLSVVGTAAVFQQF